MDFSQSLSEWAKDKPLSILQLDPADRAVLKIADERDAIQKKTFTKWLNKHLKKVNRHIDDLFEDLRDGHNLISLLEVLSGELVPRERGRMRFHQLQNVQIALDFLKNRNIKLVNIRPEDIVDGNPKLTLGLIWTIILHFQISDIITGLADETVSAREALLKWAQRTTERYPGVRITDFTNSWKDGLAFNAILHRNRPDLLDFRSLRTRNAKENLELAFSIAEKEFGITKLLDPEDVDTPEPDEKSLITYISSIYDVFPEPPAYHPFADDEKNRKIEEYKDLAVNLQRWMLGLLQEIKNQKMCNTLIDLKSLLLETSKFRSDELPKKNKDKQRLSHLHREIQKMSRDTGRVEFLKDLQLEEIEKNWNRVTVALQERDQKIRDEICRLEKLQKIAEKFNRESKLCDGKLDDVERRINDEEKRIQRLHIVDAKYNCDQIESELKHIDDILKSLKKDITILEEKNYHQTTEMKIRLENIRERSTCIKKVFQCTLVSPLTERSEKSGDEKKVKQRTASNDKAEYSKTLKEHFEWIERKQKRVDQIDFGQDYQAIKTNLDQIKNEQKSVELYKKKIASLKTIIKRGEADSSSEEAEKLESKFQSLESFVAQKLRDSESLLDFIQSASRELKWMKEKEEAEVSRDWSAKNLNLVELEHHQETLTNDLEKREIQFNAVQSRGESLLLQKHPAAKCIEEYLANMQNLWSWLLQLTLCLEIHLSYAQMYHQFFKEAHECEQWLKKNEDKLNTTFSRNVSSIDEGERYLKQMEDLRDDLTRYNDLINGLEQRSHEIVPLKLRKIQCGKALSVIAICNYKNPNIDVSKDEKCTVKDTSHKVMWKIITSTGIEGIVPGVCFLIPPPNPEAIELGQSLKKRYDDVLNLWKLKQRKLRQNLILATMKVVKTWDISHFRSMDVGQRESIMRALNTDAQKLISEGSDSEPALIKLKQEMEQCNNLFNTLLKKINEEETEKSPKTSGRKISDTLLGLQNVLNEKEKFMKNKLHAPIMWDLDNLENLVIEHKDFEIGLRALESQISEVAQAFKSMSRKTTALQMKYDTLIQTWDRIWESSNAYIEKLKAIEVGLHRLNEAIQAVSNVEVHLASCDSMPAELGDLQKVHDSLLSFQIEMQQSQNVIDEVQESARKLRDLVQRIRTKQSSHADVNKFENDVQKLVARWDNARSQIVERLRSCGASSELLRAYKTKMEKDSVWISETTVKMNSMKTVKKMTTKEIEMTVEPAMDLYSSVAERCSSIEETNILGARYIREAKAIIEENYKVCKENAAKLTSWMKDIEFKLADLGIVREQLPGLQHQITVVKILKEELENQQHLVTGCLDEMRQLAQRGIEVLNKEEITLLQGNLISLKKRYDSILNECDRLLRRLTSAFEELQKYKSELDTLKEWLNNAQLESKRKEEALSSLTQLEKNSEAFRLFSSDVIAHQADLRFITMAAQKFIDESQDYLKALNAFRKNLPPSMPTIKSTESEVKSEVQEVTTVYHNLLNHVTRLTDNYSIICNKYRTYVEAIQKAVNWLNEVKKSSKKALEEPVADEPSLVQEQLDKIKLINMEVVGQGRLVENICQAFKILMDTLETCNVMPNEAKSLEQTVSSIQEDYIQLVNSIAGRIKELQAALIHSQDIQGTLDRILKWLEETETTMKMLNKPISLTVEKLDEQVQEFKILKSDIDNQKQSLDMLLSTANELTNNANPKLVRKVDSKVKEISQRFDKLCEKITKRGNLLEEISDSVRVFQAMVVQFEEWNSATMDRIESTDSVHLVDVDGFSSVIEYTLNQRNSKKDDFEQMIKIGKNLVSKKDVSDVTILKDKIQALEQQWKDLGETLNEKKQKGKVRAEQLAAYEALRVKVLDWLLKIERDFETTEPIALDQSTLKKQSSEILGLLKEHSDYSSTVEKLNNIGTSCDTVVKGDTSPKRKAISPIKKPSSPTRKSPPKSRSTDSFSVSSGRVQTSMQSPLSTVSSGFSSRRSSTDNIGSIDDLTPIQLQLSEINDRYNLLRMKMSDRSQEITATIEDVKLCMNILKAVTLFIESKEKQLPKQSLPSSKDTIDKQLKLLKEIQEEMLEKQCEMDNLKTKVNELVNKKNITKGSSELQTECEKLEKRWIDLLVGIKNHLGFLHNLKEFQESQLLLQNWLVQKKKMFSVLGPIASDPRLVSSQVQQVQVMRDEFTSQKDFMERLNELAKVVCQYLQTTGSSSLKITEQMDVIHQHWDDLSSKLIEREKNLEAASGMAKDFHKTLTDLQVKLQQISDTFDSFSDKGFIHEVLLKKLMALEEDLEKQRTHLTDADSVCEQLCNVLSDSASKTDIKYKVSILEKMYSTLRKKIDIKRAETESSLKEDKLFYKSCEEIQGWLKEMESSFTQYKPLSTDIQKLFKMSEEYEQLYKQIMGREHEVHLCLSKGTEILPKLTGKPETTSLKTRLENIKKQWEKLKKTAIDRHTCLQSCIQNSKKYHAAIEKFRPWLNSEEEKFKSQKHTALKREKLNKELKETQTLKSDLSLHVQEFENICSLGEGLLSSCEADTESVKKELDLLKKKWKIVNNDITMRIQSLEEMSQILLEYEEKIRDLQHSVQRLEDRLRSHDALGDMSCDPVLLNRLQALLLEAVDMKAEFKKVKDFAKMIIEKADKSCDSSEIFHCIESLESKHEALRKELESRCTTLNASYKVISVFMEHIKDIRSDLNSLDEEFDNMQPIAHDLKFLKIQLKDIEEFHSNLLKTKHKFSTAEKECKNIEKHEHILDSKSYVEQMKTINRQIIRLEEHIKTRETAIKTMITRIENFYAIYLTVMSDLNAVLKEAAAFETIGGDVDIIRSQQQTFKKLCNSRVIPLSKKIVEVNKLGQGLVQTVTAGVDTSEIEQQIEKLNTSWNSLQESINEKEKKLDVALLQSGKFQEALSGVQKWLNDTEEMVSNQKPPSSDFKVVKAQVQEQKFLKKMLLDRQNSVIGLKTMGTELMSTTKATELEQAENLMKTITVRFQELISTAEERMTVLEKTLPFAQQFQDIFIPLMDWMDTAEKRLLALSFVPVNDEQIKAMVKEHEKLTSDIESHRKYLIELNTVSEKLKQVISATESETLIQKVKSINEKFTEISHSSENIGETLKEAQKGITNFTTTYTKVISWIEKTTVQLTHFQVLSVYSDKLQIQFKDLKKLKETLDSEEKEIERVISSGEEIMKLVSGEDAIQMKEKLDSLNVKLSDVSNKLKERLKTAEESMPLVESFYSASDKLTVWLDTLERSLKLVDNSALDVQAETIKQLEESISEYRSVLEIINHTGPRLCQLSPGEGAVVIENLMSRANHRFEKVSEQVQRKAERIQLALQRKYDVVSDIDELFEWFQETEKQIAEAEGLTSEPNSLITLLKEQKALNDEINVQKNRVRDSIAAAKKLMRESSSEDLSFIHEKIETLKNQSNNVSLLCQERLSALEQAVPLAQHFFETHTDLGQWLDEAESEAELLEAPALNSHQIKKQQDRNKGLIQEVQEHKPLVDKLNKTGSALTKLCRDEESDKLEGILESDNSRYNALRKILREHQNALEEALQATSQFSDKLEGMLSALTSTADQLHNAEPISAHPERIQEQINDNKAVLQDLDKRTITLEAVKKAADDVIVKASAIDEPAVRDIKMKLDRLNDLWITIQTAARNRGKSLEEALIAAEKFWDELTAVMNALKELQGNLNGQEPPAVEPAAVQQQQEVLQEIKQEITQTKPEVDHCRQAGQNLMQLCGEPDKPEVKKHIEDLDSVWENVTTLYAKREQNLIDAMEKAMVFHDTLQNLLEFLDTVEDKFSKLGAVSSDIDSVKDQINQLKDFKLEVDPHMVQVESLNRQAQELMERTSPDQAVAIREPLADINKRWDDLLKSIVERQQEMENTLLKLGQFQHALEELMIWISKTENTLDELKPVFGDPQVIEVVLAKHKVITNDIQAHQTSIDTINRAGHEFVDSDRGSEDAKFTHSKLQNLNVRWQHLQSKSADLYKELEDALKEAQQFHQDIQDLIMWLNDIDGHLATSKPVGGLPETAKDQLNRFMDLYNELDTNRYKIENILQQGQNYMKRSGESSTKTLQHNLRTLKQKWDSVLNKANDRKIKLEIALRDATEFHEALQKFVEWLTNAEKYITSLKPVSRHMKAVLEQIEEHRNFQKDVGAHREVMLNLDKKGTHLKYFSQKQDVILIKNLLISVQHRWERVVSRAAERTRALDHGYKESKEFHDAWTSLSAWLDEAEKLLDTNTVIGNDPLKIKKLLTKHKEFQRTLGSKQVTYDATMKSGRILKDKCPKQDVPLLQDMMDELKVRWNKVCAKSVNRQRRLEEALLYSGQFKEAVMALIDWFDKAIATLSETKAYHGDLDTVTSLLDQHKSFEEELKNRGLSLESVCKTALDLKKEASSADAESLASQVDELNSKWKNVSELSEKKKKQLDEAYRLAEELHRMVHILLEWLSEAEMKLRFVGPLPEDEESTKRQILDHENFLNEMEKQEVTKNNTLEIAHDILKKCHPDGLSVIRHWITIIQSRWDEIFAWAKQRDQRLRDHLLSLKDINDLLEELLKWLINAESTLTTLEAEPLPDDLPSLDELIKEHQTFMNDMSKRQADVEKISKAFSPKRQNKGLLPSHGKEKAKEKIPRSSTPASFKTSTPLRSHLDSDIKHPRAKLLLDKWRSVWLLAMERQRRLQDKHNYLLELDRIKHFDFNEWRRRYLGWMNNKKSRIMDQFRKIDKNNDGKVTKQEFIDGILKSKFATSQLEMERVADIFDRNGDGFIDTKEYIETLRPEREGGPKTEAEKIQDEVQRQVAKCTCVHRFKVYQVGEGKYRFGDSQKLRLVRILRSTVMVRVGGGWVALDEFLVKNDPCRAKGRTNLELREQFILADGVSQSMAPFKPKPSPNSSVSSQSGTTTSMPSTGPITKIREKSERSTPMRQSRSSAENSSDISGPSFSETDSYSNRSGLSRMTPSSAHLSPRNTSCKSSSRPTSRQGSRPSSRAPSDLSQDGVQEYKRKQKQSAPGNGIHQKLQSASSKVSKPASDTKIPSIKTTVKQPSNVKASRKESWK